MRRDEILGNAELLEVVYHDRMVGRLAMTSDRKAAFEYDEDWLATGFSISPFSLPLEAGVFVPSKMHFDGLFGVFADSLPDAWGRLLVDRFMKSQGIDAAGLSPLDRLAIVGKGGMGALEFRPSAELKLARKDLDLDALARECRNIIASEKTDDLDEIFAVGGSSGGARPKAFVEVDGEEWIIKFPSHLDGADAGKLEYDYSVIARECGIDMPKTRLFPEKNGSGYFGVARFDRPEKIHVISAAALLEQDFERSLTDYRELMKLTNILTRSKYDLEQMFRRMCFNVLFHNQDDHLKNFAFIYVEDESRWALSPAYDLTYSLTYYGEHTTTVNGKGRDIERADMIDVGVNAGLSRKKCEKIIDTIAKLACFFRWHYGGDMIY